MNFWSSLLNRGDLVAIGFTSEERFQNMDTASIFAAAKAQIQSFD